VCSWGPVASGRGAFFPIYGGVLFSSLQCALGVIHSPIARACSCRWWGCRCMHCLDLCVQLAPPADVHNNKQLQARLEQRAKQHKGQLQGAATQQRTAAWALSGSTLHSSVPASSWSWRHSEGCSCACRSLGLSLSALLAAQLWPPSPAHSECQQHELACQLGMSGMFLLLLVVPDTVHC